jgi:hypothetical protein
VRSKLIALVGATLLLTGACSGDDDDGGVASRDDFMSQCTEASEGAGVPDANDYCGCVYDGLKDTLSADELRDAFSASASADVPPEATQVITDCATSSLDVPTTAAP